MRYFENKRTDTQWKWDGLEMVVRSTTSKSKEWWFSGWQDPDLLLRSDKDLKEVDGKDWK